MKVMTITEDAIKEGGIAIAVGIDIKNAFNSIPWWAIRRSLVEKEVPEYLRRIIDSYLSERSVVYRTSEGRIVRRDVEAGVPQGSVLGSLLWNVAYDSTLRVGREPSCHIICYADDISRRLSSLPRRMLGLRLHVPAFRYPGFLCR